LPRGAYNLDALGDDAFGGAVDSKPKKAPPARFANKAAAAKEEPKPSLDDMPIGGKKLPVEAPVEGEEDKPLPRGTYNLDALGADAFGDGGDALMNDVSVKPKKGPPARLANKAKEAPKPSVPVDDIPIGGAA
jgi:hypothetical protein